LRVLSADTYIKSQKKLIDLQQIASHLFPIRVLAGLRISL